MSLSRKTQLLLVRNVTTFFRKEFAIHPLCEIKVKLTRRKSPERKAQWKSLGISSEGACYKHHTRTVVMWQSHTLSVADFVDYLFHELIHWWQHNVAKTLKYKLFVNGKLCIPERTYFKGKRTDQLKWGDQPEEQEAVRFARRLSVGKSAIKLR
jgi:hypothetical protein